MTTQHHTVTPGERRETRDPSPALHILGHGFEHKHLVMGPGSAPVFALRATPGLAGMTIRYGEDNA